MTEGGGVVLDVCLTSNVSYSNRVDNPDAYDFCLVPDGGADAVFFAGLAIVVMCMVSPRWDALMTLAVGAIYQIFAYVYNLGHVTNASSLWLGMRPADIFVYVFLPPLLLDITIRIDFYMLKKSIFGVLFMAFVMVISSCILFIPFMLKALKLEDSGWTAGDAALFGATIASTDAAAVAASLQAGGAPEILAVILEGEAAFNDASSLTLFEIFHSITTSHTEESLDATLSHIVVETIWAAFTGICIGVGMGITTQIVFAWLQHRNMKSHCEVSFTVGGCYLAFYITQVWCNGSGTIGAVVYGLYGNAMLMWGISKKARATLIFPLFWDNFTFLVNGLVFFYVGASIVNFTVRSGDTLYSAGITELLKDTMYRLPLIWLYSFAMRGISLFLGFKLMSFLRLTADLTLPQVAFITVGGLRGSLSLVLAQAVAATATDSEKTPTEQDKRVTAEMAIYIAGYVVLTLIINAPLCGPLMTLLKLDHKSEEQLQMRMHVKELFTHFGGQALTDLQEAQDEDEMLQGVDWGVVEEQLDMQRQLDKALPEVNPRINWWWWLDMFSFCKGLPRRAMSWRQGSIRSDEAEGERAEEKERKQTIKNDLKRTTNWDFKGGAFREGAGSGNGRQGSGNGLQTSSQPGILVINDGPANSLAGKQLKRSKSMAQPTMSRKASMSSVIFGRGREKGGLKSWLPSIGRWNRRSKSAGASASSLPNSSSMRLPRTSTLKTSMSISHRPPPAPPSAPTPPAPAPPPVGRGHNRGRSVDGSLGGDTAFTAALDAMDPAASSPPQGPPRPASASGTAQQSMSQQQGQRGVAPPNLDTTSEGPAAASGLSMILESPLPQPSASGARKAGRLLVIGKAKDRGQQGEPSGETDSDSIDRASVSTQGVRYVQRASRLGGESYIEAIPTGMRTTTSTRPLGRGSVGMVAGDQRARTLAAVAPSGGFGTQGGFPSFESPPGHETDGIPPLPSNPPAGRDRGLGTQSVGLYGLYREPPQPAAERPIGRGSVGISKGGGRQGLSQPSAALAALAKAAPGGKASDWIPPFESPPGHELDGHQEASTSMRPLGSRSVNFPGVQRPLHGSASNITNSMFESPPGHEYDGVRGLSRFAERPLATSSVNLPGFPGYGPILELHQAKAERPLSRGSAALPGHGATSPLGRRSVGSPQHAITSASKHKRDRSLGSNSVGLFGEVAMTTLDENMAHGNLQRASPRSPPGGRSGKSLLTTSAGADGRTGLARLFGAAGLSRLKSPLGSATDLSALATKSRGQSEPPPSTAGSHYATNTAASGTLGRETIDEHEAMHYGSDAVLNEDEEAQYRMGPGVQQMLPEYRMRLLTGLKQYYKEKYEEGVLGAEAYKTLSFVCDEAHHHPQKPMDLWERVRGEVSSGKILQAEISSYYYLKGRHAKVKAMTNPVLRFLSHGLLVVPIWCLSTHLNHITMIGLETAVELHLSLTDSIQTQWLEYSGQAGAMILEEVQGSADAAWEFVVERRIEVPETFQAIQTYRACVLLLSQQRTFIQEMSSGGMIDEKTSHEMLSVVERRLHSVSKRGPHWRRQSVGEILANTPFLRGISPKVIEWVRANSHIRMFKQGDTIWRQNGEVPGIFVVISGVVRVMLEVGEGQGVVPMHLGAGGVGGLISTVLENNAPGMILKAIYAEGHAFGKGPVVLHMPRELLAAIRHFSRDERLLTYQRLELQIFKTAAHHVLDLLRSQVMLQLGAFIRGAMQDVLLPHGVAAAKPSPLAMKQRLRSLLHEQEGEAGFDWLGQLIAMRPEEAYVLLERGEDFLVELEAGEGSGHGIQAWHEQMFKAIAAATAEVYNQIRGAVRESLAVVLAPGQVMLQTSTMVLIQGTLLDIGDGVYEPPPLPEPAPAQDPGLADIPETSSAIPTVVVNGITANHGGTPPGHHHASGNGAERQRPLPSEAVRQAHPIISGHDDHVAPSIMVWTPDYFGNEVPHQDPVRIKAGHLGATLMVWGTDVASLMEQA